METSSYPIAAFCSYGNSYKSFLTTKPHLSQDVDHLLSTFDAPVIVRARVNSILTHPACPTTAEGIRIERGEGDNRTVVYASIANPYADRDSNPLPVPQHTEQKKVEEEKGAWVLA